MAVYKIFPTKDATVYTEFPTMNTGLDEILELIPNTDGYYYSKILMDFDFNEFPDTYSDPDPKFVLKLFIAQASAIPSNLIITANLLNKSWINGTGRYKDDISLKDGVSYKYRNNNDLWESNNSAMSSPTYKLTPTKIFDIGLYTTKDIKMDVTDLVNLSLNKNSIEPYYGFLINCEPYDIDINQINKLPIYPLTSEYVWGDPLNLDKSVMRSDSSEPTTIPYSNKLHNKASLKYFSRDTHTIYPPCLEMMWDDSNYNINDIPFNIIDNSEMDLNVSNNKGEFNENSINKFRINVLPKYQRRRFLKTYEKTETYILPENSCYAIKDVDTNEFLIDFDDLYTKLSYDELGGYFNLYMRGLQPERYYEILIKTNIDDESVIISNKMYFKIKKSINNFFPDKN